MREGLQRAEVEGPQSEGVKEKIRGVVEELTGMEADTDAVENKPVTALNTTTRNLRKYIHSTQAEIGGASIETLRQLKLMIDKLVDQAYEVREQEEECPTCKVHLGEPTTQASEDEYPEDLEKYGTVVAAKRRKFLEEIRAESPG